MVPDRIEREVVIEAPVERVWQVLTQPEHVGTWFGDAGAKIDLRPGGAMTISWAEHGTVRARVAKVEPHSAFAFRWADKMDAEPTDDHSTLVEFDLAAEGDGTRLRVVETGFSTLAIPEAERRAKFDGNTDGWRIELDALKEYAARVAA
jgi:uncharacterized protein YndB with AHSA1/START domain